MDININKCVCLCICICICICFIIVIYYKTLYNLKLNKTMKNISPYVILGTLLDNTKKTIIVNVLGDKIPFKIDCVESKNNLSLTKHEFETYLQNNNKYDIVILYCASWSCGAAGNYFNELSKKGLDMSNIYDYKGALHEWALYSYSMPHIFSMKKIVDNTNASKKELLELIKNTLHTYKLKDEKNTGKLISGLAHRGSSYFVTYN